MLSENIKIDKMVFWEYKTYIYIYIFAFSDWTVLRHFKTFISLFFFYMLPTTV